MTEIPKEQERKGMPPGVCIPWEQKLIENGKIAGNADILKNEWEKLDAIAYIYLWSWVHR